MRILFYYTHKQTLGHTTRSMALAAALRRCHAEVLILQGGVPQPFISFPEGCRVMDIPLPFDTRQSFESPVSPASSAKRAEFILNAAAAFNPDVFITEFFPFGRLSYTSELLPTLRYLRKQGTRMAASIGYPLLSDLDRLIDPSFAALRRSLFAFYDTLLIHTPKELENPYIQQTFPSSGMARLYAASIKELKEKIIYTGYVYPEEMTTGGTPLPEEIKDTPAIVVSRGGGAVYPKLVTLGMEAHALLGSGIPLIIACGPSTSPQEMTLFQSMRKDRKHIFLIQHLADLGGCLRSARVSVNLCGYNTSVQLMRHGTPSVAVPYQNALSKTPNDQMARALLMAERFSSSILNYDAMTAKALADAIERQMSSPRPAPAPDNWFNGADLAARLIVQGTAN